jgi:nitrite reductase (NADH) small subunit
MRRIAAGSAASLGVGKGRMVATPAEEVAVFNIKGNYFACSNRCPHAGGPLCDGMLSDTSVVCPWHGWDFDLTLSEDEALDGVTRYRVVVEDGELFIEMP